MKSKINRFELTKNQTDVCKKVEKAIIEARKLGIVLFGKQYELVAYRKEVIPYCTLEKITDKNGERLPPAPCYSMNVLSDSGSNDEELIDVDLL